MPTRRFMIVFYCLSFLFLSCNGTVEARQPSHATARHVAMDTTFSIPKYMKPNQDVFDELNLMSFRIWTYSNVLLVHILPMGAWAVDEYPEIGKPVAPELKIKDITYRNANGTVFSGHSDDGRIWYMKKHVLDKAQVPHATALIAVYPKEKYPKVEKDLIDIVKNW